MFLLLASPHQLVLKMSALNPWQYVTLEEGRDAATTSWKENGQARETDQQKADLSAFGPVHRQNYTLTWQETAVLDFSNS